jgi:hypothetical protein
MKIARRGGLDLGPGHVGGGLVDGGGHHRQRAAPDVVGQVGAEPVDEQDRPRSS